MSFKGYKSARHFYNAKAHGLSIKICNDRTALDSIIKEVAGEQTDLFVDGELSMLKLTDAQAEQVYMKLRDMLNGQNKFIKSATEPLGIKDEMTDKQKKKILAIAKYRFGWSHEALFSFILEAVPEIRKRLTPWEIQLSKLSKVWSFLKLKQADKVIKKLERIEKRNLKNQ